MAFVQEIKKTRGRPAGWPRGYQRIGRARSRPAGLFGQMSTIPGVSAEVDWVKSEVGAFLQVPQRVANAIKKASAIQAKAAAAGQGTQAAQAAQSVAKLQDIQARYDATEPQLTQLLSDLQSAGLGAVSLMTVANAVTVSGDMAGILSDIDGQEKAVTGLQTGVLSPAEIAQLGVQSTLASIGLPILIIGAGLAAVYFLFLRR